MYQPRPSSSRASGRGSALCSRAGAARHRLRVTGARPACPDRRVGMPGGGLAIARSVIYNVCMATRAMQEATFMILTALADGPQHGYSGTTTFSKPKRPGSCRIPMTSTLRRSSVTVSSARTRQSLRYASCSHCPLSGIEAPGRSPAGPFRCCPDHRFRTRSPAPCNAPSRYRDTGGSCRSFSLLRICCGHRLAHASAPAPTALRTCTHRAITVCHRAALPNCAVIRSSGAASRRRVRRSPRRALALGGPPGAPAPWQLSGRWHQTRTLRPIAS